MEFIAPDSVRDTLKILDKWKDKARLVAGGTNVIPDLRAEAISPEIMVDLSGLNELNYVKEAKRYIEIGALTTISQLVSNPTIRQFSPPLWEAARKLGSPLTRNRATIGGNLTDASPAADMAVPLLALGAVIRIKSMLRRQREVLLDQFFIGPNKSIIAPDEIITSIRFDKIKSGAKTYYYKLGKRNAMAISIVSIAICLEAKRRKVKEVRIALGAVAPRPIRAYGVENFLKSEGLSESTIESGANKIVEEISPIDDIRASAEYRSLMTQVLFKRGFYELSG